MTWTCEFCDKIFTERTNLNRHKRAFHREELQLPVFLCEFCTDFKGENLNQLERHLALHSASLRQVCSYCHTGFSSHETFAEHMENLHGLPIWGRSAMQVEDQPVQTAFNGALKLFEIEGDSESFDVLEFMIAKREKLIRLVNENVHEGPCKVQFSLLVDLFKPSENEDARKETSIFANSDMTVVYPSGLENNAFLDMVEKMLAVIFVFASEGSGWVVHKIVRLTVKMGKFNPIRGSSFLPLPHCLLQNRHKKFLLNIRNHRDHNCFKYCFTAAYHRFYGPTLSSEERNSNELTNPDTYSANNPNATQPQGEFAMPMPLSYIYQFEILNDVQVNVFRIDGRDLFPLRVSKYCDTDFVMDLLLLSDNLVHHYVLITHLLKLVCALRGVKFRPQLRLCRNCFHTCSNEEVYDRHLSSCLLNEPAVIKMPKEESCKLYFKNHKAKSFVPLVIYFDFESTLLPLTSSSPPTSNSSTHVIQKHEPSGYSLLVVEHGNPEPWVFKLNRSVGCVADFIATLHKLANDIYHRKRQYEKFTGRVDRVDHRDINCWFCEKPFESVSDMVVDHCHFSGKFLGWAHSKCNLLRRTSSFTPVIGHNIQNYDLHHLCLKLHLCDPTTTITVLPATDEKYISLTLGILIKTYTRSDGKVVKVYEYLRFLDSFKFLSASLAQLVHDLPPTKFQMMYHVFKGYTREQVNMLCEKGFYPYSYIKSFEVFNEPKLPPIEEWKNSLCGDEVDISPDNYKHACNVFEIFGCSDIGSYHDLYLTTDTVLLACVFEEFREKSFTTYGLDSCHHFTASNLSGDAFLLTCQAEIELLTQREHLEIVENMMRGGLASVYEQRFFKANNKYINTFNPKQPSTFICMFDCNNMYGGIGEHEALPLNAFSMDNTISLELILSTQRDAEFGYIVEVDLDYPDSLHDLHRDFPLAPTKMIVELSWLSQYQQELRTRLNYQKPAKVKKLMQTLFKKKNYTLHYRTLQLYVQLGMVVEKIHRVLKFRQDTWLRPYIVLNTKKRQEASSKFEENFHKLMNNSAYGKTCESKRNRLQVKLVRNADQVLQETAKFTFKSFKIFGNDFAAITLNQSSILWNKPTIVGATILDLSKRHMFEFHYFTMKSNFICRVMYSDTDSLIYAIESDDVYEELMTKIEILDQFDFSNYDPNHALYSNKNKLVTLKFKDEFGGKIIREFVALKPKLYSLLVEGKQKKSAKGISKHAQKALTHELFKETLLSNELVRTENTRIQSTSHVLQTVRTNKISLSSYDDKRYIMSDGIQTLPFGHHTLQDEMFYNLILNSPDWGNLYGDAIPLSTQTRHEHMGPDWENLYGGVIPSNTQTTHEHIGLPITADASWHTPDPGLNRTPIRESDIDSSEIVDFDNEIELPSPPRNPFIEYEAVESDLGDTSFVLQSDEEAEEDNTPSPQIGSKRKRAFIEEDDE